MKKISVMILVALIAAGSVFAGGSNQSGSSASGSAAPSGPVPYTIEVGGSTSVSPLMELFEAEYVKANPHITIRINGTGSGDGITNTGVAYQIGMSSRELTATEMGAGLTVETIAIDGIAVIVNSSNPVTNLTIDQIRDIFTGAVTRWEQLGAAANGKTGAIAVVSRESGSGTRGAFEEIVRFQNQLVAGANEINSTGGVRSSITSNADAIGYISLGSISSEVKAISVGSVAATNANVVNGTYAIARPFLVLSAANVTAESKAFLAWMLTKPAQDIVATSWIRVDQ